jgi:hypothetical protein
MKIKDPIIREVLETGLRNKVGGLSAEERERMLDAEATRLLRYEEPERVKDIVLGSQVKMPINEQRVVDSIAAVYLVSKAHPYKSNL